MGLEKCLSTEDVTVELILEGGRPQITLTFSLASSKAHSLCDELIIIGKVAR